MFAAARSLLSAALLLAAGPALAQYDPRAAFAPFPMEQAVNVYRSGSGLPGPQYWQNRADYTIHATLDPDARAPTLSGDEVITYTNNSPDTLQELWVHLDQNIYKAGSRSQFANGTAPRGTTDGVVLDRVEIEQGGKFVAADYLVSDTRMKVALPAPLMGKGTRVGLYLPYGQDWVVTWLAAARIGALVMPLATTYRPAEIRKVLRIGDIDTLVTARVVLGHDMQDMLEACVAATGSGAHLVWAPDAFLVEHGVEQWTGLPLWAVAEGELSAVWDIDPGPARAAGLTWRPIAETVRDTWAWLSSGEAIGGAIGGAVPDEDGRINGHGLSPDREEQLLALLH